MKIKLLIILSFLIYISILVFFHTKGAIYYDEGYILNSALRITNGQIPYKDFDMAYTPLSFLTTALFFKIFGISVLSGRLVALIISILSTFVLYKILRENKSTVVKLTPAHLTLLKDMDNANSSVKRFIVGGEDLKVALAKEVYNSFDSSLGCNKFYILADKKNS